MACTSGRNSNKSTRYAHDVTRNAQVFSVPCCVHNRCDVQKLAIMYARDTNYGHAQTTPPPHSTYDSHNSTATNHLGATPNGAGTAIEREFEGPQALVGIRSEGVRDSEFDIKGKGETGDELGDVVATAPAPARVPCCRGSTWGDDPWRR